MMEEKIVFWNSAGQISPHLLYEFFSENGIGKFFTDNVNMKNSDPVIVKINGNIVSPVNIGYLLELTKDYILSTISEPGTRGSVLDSLHQKTSLFSDRNVKLLKTLSLRFISDTPDKGYLFFKNGVVEVTNDQIRVRQYSDFEDYVWEKTIIPFDFTVVDLDTLKEKSDFMVFLGDLSVVADPEKSISRVTSLMSAVGYLLHRYKNPATTKAIILMDTYLNGQPSGGTGKSLLINSIGKIRQLALIDGKFWDSREWFCFSSVDLESEILLFDDVDIKFRFEQIFPLVSTGMNIKRKYKDHVYLPFEKAPKVAITTNYAINGDSSSFRRRKFEYEITPTFSAEYTPRDKFGRNFFEEWQDEDWNIFYNMMVRCMQVFLQNGLLESEPINLKLTKLISKTCEEFVEWADANMQIEIQYVKKALYDKYLSAYPEYKTKVKQRDFTFWLRSWGEYKRYISLESHSGDMRYIKYTSSHPEGDNQLESDSENLNSNLFKNNINGNEIQNG